MFNVGVYWNQLIQNKWTEARNLSWGEKNNDGIMQHGCAAKSLVAKQEVMHKRRVGVSRMMWCIQIWSLILVGVDNKAISTCCMHRGVLPIKNPGWTTNVQSLWAFSGKEWWLLSSHLWRMFSSRCLQQLRDTQLFHCNDGCGSWWLNQGNDYYEKKLGSVRLVRLNRLPTKWVFHPDRGKAQRGEASLFSGKKFKILWWNYKAIGATATLSKLENRSRLIHNQYNMCRVTNGY